MRDIYFSGYVAGGNTKFFGSSEETVSDAINNRLDFKDDWHADYGSMLAFAVPENSQNRRDQAFSLTVNTLPWDTGGAKASQPGDESFPGGRALREAYDKVFGLSAIHYGSNPNGVANMEFLAQGSTNNSLCFAGPYREMGTDNKWQLSPGQGHLGTDALPGVRPTPLQPPPTPSPSNHPCSDAGRALAPRRVRLARSLPQVARPHRTSGHHWLNLNLPWYPATR